MDFRWTWGDGVAPDDLVNRSLHLRSPYRVAWSKAKAPGRAWSFTSCTRFRAMEVGRLFIHRGKPPLKN